MTPQERQLVDDLFDRLSKVESAPRDPDAAAAISEGLRKAPNAIYALVQTVLLQDEALKRAHERIQELERGGADERPQSGGFLDSMRETIFGQAPQRGSVPNVPPPEAPNRPTWNSGQVMQRAQGPGQYAQAPYGQPYGAPQAPMGGAGMGGAPMGGGGGSFLGTAAAAAAGVVGGSLLLGSIRSMMGGMGGGHQAFGDSAGLGGGEKPWGSDQSSSDLARDAGVNDIGSSGSRAGDTSGSRAGLFDSDSKNDNSSNNNDSSSNNDNSGSGWFDTASNDDDQDEMDYDSDDFGGDDSDIV
jgi:hypothetical protein